MVILQYINDFLEMLPYRRLRHEKQDLRNRLQQKRRILTKQQICQGSEEVIEKLLTEDAFVSAKHVVFYYPMRGEIDLRALLEKAPDKHFYLPVTHRRRRLTVHEYTGVESVRKGRHGVLEPQTPEYKGPIDCIIVPAVGFDHEMHRLGRGGGYYDTFLHSQRKAKRIGVGYAFQMVEQIPAAKHDEKMDCIVTANSI